MAEPDKRQIGDGSDNYGEAAKQMAKAAKEAGKEMCIRDSSTPTAVLNTHVVNPLQSRP